MAQNEISDMVLEKILSGNGTCRKCRAIESGDMVLLNGLFELFCCCGYDEDSPVS